MPLRARRVGIIVNGKPDYRLVAESQNDTEVLARCIREMPDGLAFHDEQPGITAWNEQAQRFEYRDRNDSRNVMLELKHDGLIHYVSVKADSLRPDGGRGTVHVHGMHERAQRSDLACAGSGWQWRCNHQRMASASDRVLGLRRRSDSSSGHCRPRRLPLPGL
ncbi:hypothetical protein [Pseudomonas fluorescens]|uniref:hypothetical protein n=1 Tax=Pseudomonas fluorescens TaxID=294 RepID=UPI001240A5B7|nr:hypothetical protein [Pseudomonas fluorescens]